MVNDGLTPPTVGNTDPSQIHKIADVPASAIGVDHAGARIVAHPCGAVHVTGVVGLPPDVRGIDRLQRLGHEVQRVADQFVIVVAPGVFDAGDRQSILVLVIGQRDPIVGLRHHLADDLQADLMVVVLHRRHQRRRPTDRAHRPGYSPRAAAADPGSCSNSRRRNPSGRRSSSAPSAPATAALVGSGFPAPRAPRPPGSPAPSGSVPTRPELLASPSGCRSVAEFNSSRGVSIA